MSHKVELLAPAGNMESFYGAVHAGADAVYLGGEHFGARAYADNFTAEEILICLRYAHIWGCRVYLTVNTLVKEKEFGDLPGFLGPLYEGGLDGVIVQDIGVFAFIRDCFPGLKLHVSTQMTVTGGYGAVFLKELGADRIVPARELGLAELKAMKEIADIEIEAFIHGAMCYSYSGQCLFSSILGGRSGNRGRCAQPCRLPYRVRRTGAIVQRDTAGGSSRGGDPGEMLTEECYPLSLKDMCTIERIPELIEAGIDSFKIEGRMKKPEYAAGVTAIYRKYIERYYEGGARETAVAQEDIDALASLYIRSGRQDGYYFRRRGRDMVTLDSPSYNGSEEAYLMRIRERYLEKRPRMEVSVQADFRIGEPARVSFILERQGRVIRVTAVGDIVFAAAKQPVTEENIARQLGKLGETSFCTDAIEICLEEGAFYPLKAINELRRQAVGMLEDALIAENGFAVKRNMDPAVWAKGVEGSADGEGCGGLGALAADEQHEKRMARTDGGAIWHLAVRTREQFDAVAGMTERLQSGLQRLYLDADLLADAAEEGDGAFFSRCLDLRDGGCELAIALPHILRGADEAWLCRMWESYERYRDYFAGFLVRSVDGLGFLRERKREGMRMAVYGDAGLYVWNRNALRTFFDRTEGLGLDGFCLPYELNAGEQRPLLEEHVPCEKIVYGRIPLMVAANCVANTTNGCRNGRPDEKYELVDRYRKHFPIVRNCRHCVNLIYNSVPLSLHNEVPKWREQVSLRMDFTVESGEETARVFPYFVEGSAGRPFYEYTTGHEKRGAE